jgi:hypothetical protein
MVTRSNTGPLAPEEREEERSRGRSEASNVQACAHTLDQSHRLYSLEVTGSIPRMAPNRYGHRLPVGRPVNGVAGAVIGRPGRPFAVVAVTVANGRITVLDFVVDPEKLARVTA